MKASVTTLKRTGASCVQLGITLVTMAALNALFLISAAAIVTDALHN